MVLFAYLNSALQFEATEVHLTRSGRIVREVSLDVSEARTDFCASPPTATCLLLCISKGNGEEEESNVLFASLLVNCPPPPFKSLYISLEFSMKQCLLWQSPMFHIIFHVSHSISIQSGDNGRQLLRESHSLQYRKAVKMKLELNVSRQYI